MSVMIVGESPSRLGTGKPFSGPSGDRLAYLLGIQLDDLPRVATLVNLFSTPMPEDEGSISWSRIDARAKAKEFWRIAERNYQKHGSFGTVVLCGTRVWEAFEMPSCVSFLEVWPTNSGINVAKFPHPSSLSRWWNDPGRVSSARHFLRSWVPLDALPHQAPPADR